MALVQLRALNGHKLNVETTGDGLTALAIHGFTGSLDTWESLVQAADAEFRILRADMLGHGGSDSPAEVYLYDMGHTVSALRELLDHFSLSEVNWLGYSMGGRIALAGALNLPERTRSLILESASPGIADPCERELRRRSDETLAARIESRAVEDFVQYWESLPMWRSQSRLSPGIRATLHQRRLKNHPTGLANSLRGLGSGAQYSLWDNLEGLHVPALLIAGEEDAKFKTIAEGMHARIQGSRLAIVPEAGHTVHLEQPEAFNRLVIDFLKQVPPPAPARPASRGILRQAKEDAQ